MNVRSALLVLVMVVAIVTGLMFLDGQRAGSVVDVPTSAPTQTSSSVQTTTVPGVSYFVQLDSTSSLDSLRTLVQSDTDRWSSIVGIPLETYRVIESDGTVFYRIGRTVPSKAAADSECATIKSKGGDCLSLSFKE